MATVSINANVGTNLGGGQYSAQVAGGSGDVIALSAAATAAQTPVTAALAVLVADGASPTQAHVTTLNNAYTTFKAAQVAFQASLGKGDMTIIINTATITTTNAFLAVVRKVIAMLGGLGIFTA